MNKTALKDERLKEIREKRIRYEARIKEASAKKNSHILQANSDYEAEIKAIRREIYGK